MRGDGEAGSGGFRQERVTAVSAARRVMESLMLAMHAPEGL